MTLGRCERAQGEGKGKGKGGGPGQRPRLGCLPVRVGKAVFGTLQTLMPTLSMSALEGEADIPNPRSDVR
jgi:hypothetical protein